MASSTEYNQYIAGTLRYIQENAKGAYNLLATKEGLAALLIIGAQTLGLESSIAKEPDASKEKVKKAAVADTSYLKRKETPIDYHRADLDSVLKADFERDKEEMRRIRKLRLYAEPEPSKVPLSPDEPILPHYRLPAIPVPSDIDSLLEIIRFRRGVSEVPKLNDPNLREAIIKALGPDIGKIIKQERSLRDAKMDSSRK